MDESLNDLGKAINTLSREKDKLDIALYYTHHDADKAKDMVAGVYKDMFVIKAKFFASTIYGGFLLFFNIPYCSYAHSAAIMSPSYSVDELKTKNSWKVFEEEISELIKTGGHNNEMTSKLRDDLAVIFTLKIGQDQSASELKKYLEAKDEISANRTIKKFIHAKFGFLNINLTVDYEQISSLDMELFSATSKKLNKETLSAADNKNKEPEKLNTNEEQEDDIDKKDIQLILSGSLVLSPMKGKPVSSLVTGDKVKIILDKTNPKAVTVAKAFKVYKDDSLLPITGRIVSVRHLMDGGYKIYCLIAKGIYVKIEEEEEDIKIAAEIPGEIDESKAIPKGPVIIAIGFGFSILVLIILVIKLL